MRARLCFLWAVACLPELNGVRQTPSTSTALLYQIELDRGFDGRINEKNRWRYFGERHGYYYWRLNNKLLCKLLNDTISTAEGRSVEWRHNDKKVGIWKFGEVQTFRKDGKKSKLHWGGNTEDHEEIGWEHMDWIDLALNRYRWVFGVGFSLQDFKQKFCMHFLPLPCANAQPIE